MKFIIFVIDTESATAHQAEMDNIDKFNERLQKNNYWVMAAGISSPITAKLIDNRNNLGKIESGSIDKTPEFYSGFWIIDVPSVDLATELAKEGSNACNRKVELRSFLN